MGNPRRDAFEYGALMVLSTSMAAAYGFLLAYSSQKNPDGTRRRLPKVNLEDEINLSHAFEDLKKSISSMSWNNSTLSRLSKSSSRSESSKGTAASTSDAPNPSPTARNQATK